MFDIRDVPDYFQCLKFDNGISVEFNDESMLMFYDSDDNEVMRMDPADLTALHAAYRAMVLERMEEYAISGKDDLI